MATPTNQQMLDSARAAIYSISVNGQSYRMFDGTEKTSANLSELRKLVRDLEAAVAAEAAGAGESAGYGFHRVATNHEE